MVRAETVLRRDGFGHGAFLDSFQTVSIVGPRGLPARAGRYELLSLLGRGGMGSVYLGRDTSAAPSAPLVAVKVAHAHLVDGGAETMLADEARVLGQIVDPRVVPLVALERTPEGLLFVMPFVPGVTAAALAKAAGTAGVRIPVRIVLAIVCDALDGLAAAHDARALDGSRLGVIHRDVSPQNFLVGTDGVTRVLDFGVAKARGRLQKTTRDGALKGKLAYMSPEQLQGNEVDATTDLYAAAVVAWELLAGEALFLGESEADTFRRVLTAEVPSVLGYRDDVPVALDQALRRALSETRATRYSSAHDMRAAFAALVRPAAHAEVGALVADLCKPLVDAQAAAVRGAGGPTVVSGVPVAPPRHAPPASRRRRRIALVAAALALVGVALLAASLAASLRGRTATDAKLMPPAANSASSTTSLASALPLPASVASDVGPSPHPVATHHSSAPVRRVQHCDPPYTFDRNGRKIFRPECF